jgi:hypothetical protein
MFSRTRALLAGSILVVTAVAWLPHANGSRPAVPLPERLGNAAFWELSSSLSEPDGFFRSDNLVSNEIWFQHVVPDLAMMTRPGGAYVGVGPEQNFTYIAALRPRLAFIVDIRRGNLHLHLLYKALFELSADRAEFVSRLFSLARPGGIDGGAAARELFDAFAGVEPGQAEYDANAAQVREHLTRARGLPLSAEDLAGIERVYRAFFTYGPDIQYGSSGGRAWRSHATYADLMTATDAEGTERSYLSSEASFAVVKDLHHRNLIVPVVGNFAGATALRGVGRYLAERGAVVSAFYLSNVEHYLRHEGRWREFCRNAASLPIDGASQFIRSVRNGPYGFGMRLNSELGTMVAETRVCRF